jgi:hypothetical protein
LPAAFALMPDRTRCENEVPNDVLRNEVPAARRSHPSPKPPRTLLAALVKPSGSGFDGPSRLLEAVIGDVDFRKSEAIGLSGHTSPLDAGKSERQPRPYPLTNGIAGGKLPRGNLGSGSPRWSFSAAVR